MKDIEKLYNRILGLEIECDLDLPDEKEGSAWLDFKINDEHITIEWRQDLGFGLYIGGNSFGGKPNELYRNIDKLWVRILLLVENRKTLSIKDMRELAGYSQRKLGEILGQQQASISKIESRLDNKVTTIFNYIEALGGSLELTVSFEDCEMPLKLIFDDQEESEKPRNIKINKPSSNINQNTNLMRLTH